MVILNYPRSQISFSYFDISYLLPDLSDRDLGPTYTLIHCVNAKNGALTFNINSGVDFPSGSLILNLMLFASRCLGKSHIRQVRCKVRRDIHLPYDNGSGRAIRNVKVKLKVSGQFKTLQCA